MMFFPNTVVDVFRDNDATDVDVFGDETETGADGAPLLSGVPAAVVETSQVRYSAADLRAEVVEQVTVRIGTRWGIREGDRLRDRRDGSFYQVQGVSVPRGIAASNGAKLTAKRVGVSE